MTPKIVASAAVDWIEPPGHYDCYSKLLINPDNSDTQYLDVRVSVTKPQGRIERHVHSHAENIYYIIRGKGVVELDGVRHAIECRTAVFIPPGVEHALYNTGSEDLVTIFIGCPAADMSRVARTSKGSP